MTGGSSSLPDMSIGLQLLAVTIEHSLRIANGQRVVWTLVMEGDGIAQYVSNAERADALALLEAMARALARGAEGK